MFKKFSSSLQQKQEKKIIKLENVPLLAKSVEVYHKTDKPQAHIILGFQAISVLDKSRYAFRVLEFMLSGQGGSLFLELRDKASLAYTVCPLTLLGVKGGFFAVYIACDPKKVQIAIKMIRNELNKISNNVINSKLENAKQYLIGAYKIAMQRNSVISHAVLANKILGFDDSYLFEYPSKIKAVTDKQVKDLASKIFFEQRSIDYL